MYKNLYVSADSNVKNINFDLRNKVSQRITRNDSDVHRLSKNNSGTKSCLSINLKAVEFDPDEYQKFKYHHHVQKSYVPTPLTLKKFFGSNLLLHRVLLGIESSRIKYLQDSRPESFWYYSTIHGTRWKISRWKNEYINELCIIFHQDGKKII